MLRKELIGDRNSVNASAVGAGRTGKSRRVRTGGDPGDAGCHLLPAMADVYL